MPDNRILLLFQRKENNYQLLKKIIGIVSPICGKEFRLKDLLCLDSLSWTEKKNLRNVFGGDYSGAAQGVKDGKDIDIFRAVYHSSQSHEGIYLE